MTIIHWAWLITAVIALLLGLLAAKFNDEKKSVAYLIGLLVASVGASVALYFEIETMRNDQAVAFATVVPTLKSPMWNDVVQDIAQYDRQNHSNPLEETLHEPLRHAIAQRITEAREGRISIPDKREAVVVTLKLIERAQQSVKATSYINPKEWWQADIGPDYDTQSKSRHVKLFQRLFIVGSAQEARELRPIMEGQQKAGIDVKLVCASGLSPDQRTDFIVVDDSVAGVLLLSLQREFKDSQFYSTKTRADDYDRLFTTLWVGAKRPAEIPQLNCRAGVGR